MLNSIVRIVIGYIQAQIVGYYKMTLPCADALRFTPLQSNGFRITFRDEELVTIEEDGYLYEIANIKERSKEYEKRIFDIINSNNR